MRNRFWLGCLVGALLVAPACSSTDQSVDETAIDESTLLDDSAISKPDDATTSPALVGPCLKVCLVNGYPWPLPADAGGGATAGAPDQTGSTDPTCVPASDGTKPADPGCVTPVPVPPPPSTLKCMKFCAPAPGCKLVCDPFNLKTGPGPMTSATGGQPGVSSDPSGGGVMPSPPVPFVPMCKWECPPPPPPPGKKCGPWPGGQCDPGQVCNVQGCLPGAGGVCVARPQYCTADVTPVCGCDGKTYSNDCGRLAAGVALSAKGECKTPPPPQPPPAKKCGPFPGGECAKGEVCDVVGCQNGAGGLCQLKPQDCIALFAPVCGCDGKTYGNNCERLAAGVGLSHEGACAGPQPPVPCCKSICPDASKPCPTMCDPSAMCTP